MVPILTSDMDILLDTSLIIRREDQKLLHPQLAERSA